MAASRWFFAVVVFHLALTLVAAPAFAHDEDTLTPATPTSPPPAPLSPVGAADTHVNAWPYVFMGVGVLTLGTGIWLVHRDHTDNQDPACTTSPIGHTTCPYGTASAWQGWAFVALGAELAIAGAAWRIYEVRHAKKTVSVIAGLGDLSVVGSF